MISTQKSRSKLLLPKHYYYYFLFHFSHYNSKGNIFYSTISQLLQEGKFRHKNRKTQKTQKLILLFSPFSTVFPSLKHKLNTNQI